MNFSIKKYKFINYIKNILYKIKKINNFNKLKKFYKIVELINSYDKKFSNFNDNEFYSKTIEFKNRIKNGENLDKILIESFALAKEACKRVLNINLFKNQIIGGIVLHNGSIAEMITGEGKTIAAILPAYLNALNEKSVHIVTMNDYLAERDAKNNEKVFNLLGLTVGINISNISRLQKKNVYKCDIVYGTNNEYGFDYLKDNLVINFNEKVQRDLNYVIIDEIDSILIDEARTPLIISEYSNDFSFIYKKINNLVKNFIEYEFKLKLKFNQKYIKIDFKFKEIILTDLGFKLLEKLMIKFNFIKKNKELYSDKNAILIKYLINSLKAHIFFKKDIDYIIDSNNNILIIDEHTGRISKDRRWSDGIHQFIEAKENVHIKNESRILSSITFQNYFNLYNKLSGMTGTAETEKDEFYEIYNLNIVKIPTNKPLIRKDYNDLIFITEKDKFKNIYNEIILRLKNNQPILIGTTSIEKSEILSKKLNKLNIKHNVLNAKYHYLEANIISQAGKPGSVTIATNMAGRGTDIVLGGNCKNILFSKKKYKLYKKKINFLKNIVINSGGLHIIGTERHFSRRIDNQLKGRSGRQGDPGSSQFYLSMEDNLIKTFISEKIISLIKSINKNKNFITNKWFSKIIETAQLNIEKRNFEIRKQLIIYDNIVNIHRNIVFEIRNNLLIEKKLNNIIKYIYKNIIFYYFNKYINLNLDINSCIKNLNNFLFKNLNFFTNIEYIIYYKKYNLNKLKLYIYKYIMYDLYIYQKNINLKNINYVKKIIFLKFLDFFWKNHIQSMDLLKNHIFLRSYANKDPKQEYQIESFYIFKKMIFNWKFQSLNVLNKIIYLSYKKKILNFNNYQNNYYKIFDINDINYFIKILIKNN